MRTSMFGGSKRDDTKEEHDEEQTIGYGSDDSPDRLYIIRRSAERRPARRRDAIPRRPATSNGQSRRRDEHSVRRQRAKRTVDIYTAGLHPTRLRRAEQELLAGRPQ